MKVSWLFSCYDTVVLFSPQWKVFLLHPRTSDFLTGPWPFQCTKPVHSLSVEEPLVHHQSFPSQWTSHLPPSNVQSQKAGCSHDYSVSRPHSLAEQPFFWCPPPTWRPNPPLLHVYSYHPQSCHHHFLPVIAFHTSTSTLYDPIYFMFPNTDEQIF